MTRSFVYVSAAQAGVIDIFALDESGGMTAVGSCPAGPLVMPMAVSPDGRRLHAAVRSEPFRLLTFAIDPETGLLTEAASAPAAGQHAGHRHARRPLAARSILRVQPPGPA